MVLGRPLSHAEVAQVFNTLFEAYAVHMHGGFVEPLYLPPGSGQISPGIPEGVAEIRVTRDYTASALHEAAHWCVAGRCRRRQIDYGYWYQAPPRKRPQRRTFFRMEQRNQALEKIFSAAAGVCFKVSADDLELPQAELDAFAAAVDLAAQRYLLRGLAPRAEAFVRGLKAFRSRLQP